MRSPMTARAASAAFATVSALILLASAGPALADHYYGPGGFQGPAAQAQVNTVAQARKAWDDTWVTLTGHIVQRLPGDGDDYLFRDATGEIEVDIDHELFRGRTVTPETKVRISGEVDRDYMVSVSIDVDYLETL